MNLYLTKLYELSDAVCSLKLHSLDIKRCRDFISSLPEVNRPNDAHLVNISKFFITDYLRGSVPNYEFDSDVDARKRGWKINGEEVYLRQPKVIASFYEPFKNTGRDKRNTIPTNIKFTTNVSQTADYALIEIDKLQPSHTMTGKRNPAHFLAEAQPKDRTGDDSYSHITEMAKKLNPNLLLDCGSTEEGDAYRGAPVVNIRGEVIQGNGRAMAMKLAYEEYPKAWNDYCRAMRKWWLDHCPKSYFALSSARMTEYAVVRVVDVSDQEAINLGHYKPGQLESGGDDMFNPRDVLTQLISRNRLSAFLTTALTDNRPKPGEEKTLTELLTENFEKTIGFFVREKFISPSEARTAYANISEGKTALKQLFEAMLFTGAANNLDIMFASLPQAAQLALYLLMYREYKMPDDKKLMSYLRESIAAYHLAATDGVFDGSKKSLEDTIKNITLWTRQSYFAEDGTLRYRSYSKFVVWLMALYRVGTRKDIVRELTKIYDIAQGTMQSTLMESYSHEPTTLAEAVKQVTGCELDGKGLKGAQLGGNQEAFKDEVSYFLRVIKERNLTRHKKVRRIESILRDIDNCNITDLDSPQANHMGLLRQKFMSLIPLTTNWLDI